MSRLPYAARTLIKQVGDIKPKATVEPHGEVDGFNVHRTIRFDKTSTKHFAPLLEKITDKRIEEHHVTDDGYLHVTFVSSPNADLAQEFPLDAAAQVLKSESPSSEDSE